MKSVYSLSYMGCSQVSVRPLEKVFIVEVNECVCDSLHLACVNRYLLILLLVLYYSLCYSNS